MSSSVDEIVCIRLGGGHIVTTRCLALLGLVVFGGFMVLTSGYIIFIVQLEYLNIFLALVVEFMQER